MSLLDMVLSNFEDDEGRLRSVVAVCVDNIANYLWTNSNRPNLTHFTPPWPLCWFEWLCPKTEGVSGQVHMGFYVRKIDSIQPTEEVHYSFVCAAKAVNAEYYQCSMFDSFNNMNPHYAGNIVFAVLPNGGLLTKNNDGWFLGDEYTFNFVWIALTAIGFLHCKNVVRREIAAPRHERRRALKEGRDLIRFHRLEIEPMKSILRTDGGSSDGPQRALHICRGHFRTYAEKGLFGREDRKGTFWTPMHIRGDKKEGLVIKDYDVKPPAAPDA